MLFRSRGDEKYARLFINLGKADGFFPEQLIDLVNSNTKGKKIPIGKIDLLKSFSFFEVEESYADYLITTLNNVKYLDQRVAVEIAQEKDSNKGQGRESSRRKTSGKPEKRKDKRKKKESRRSYY